MPVSAYLNAALFVVAAAAALFAAAGTIAIPGFWAYLAIFAAVMIVPFTALDQDLLRERMRPGGKKQPLSLTIRAQARLCFWKSYIREIQIRPAITSFPKLVNDPSEHPSCGTRVPHDVVLIGYPEGRLSEQVFDPSYVGGIVD